MNNALPHASSPDALPSLVEHRTSFGGDDLELSVYDTYEAAHGLTLRGAHPIFSSMVTGRKVVHFEGQEPFDFVPGESLVIPPLQTLHIDFPDAGREPARCLTLEIDRGKVERVVGQLNEEIERPSASEPWEAQTLDRCHFQNTEGMKHALHSLARLFSENPPHRDALIDLTAAKLIVRMLQSESRRVLMGEPERHSTRHGLAAAVQHAQENLHRSFPISELAEAACMSESSFYRHFRAEFGMTPLQYVTEQRIERARELLTAPHRRRSVTDVSGALGFSSTSHFIDTFKKHAGTTPKQYQLHHADRS